MEDERQGRLGTPHGAVAYRMRPGLRAGVPLVLLHGRAANSTQWDGVIEALGGGPTVLTVDLPCHGASRPYEGFHYDHAADHVAEIMRDELDGPACVVGHSTGGVVAQVLAARNPELVRSLVISDAAPVHPGVYSKLELFALKRSAGALLVYEERSVHSVATVMSKELAATKVGRERLREVFDVVDGHTLLGLFSIADGELARYLERLEAPLDVPRPTALVCGQRDKLNKIPRHMRAWAKSAGTPLDVLPGCGHFCMLDDPTAFADIVQKSAQVDSYAS